MKEYRVKQVFTGLVFGIFHAESDDEACRIAWENSEVSTRGYPADVLATEVRR